MPEGSKNPPETQDLSTEQHRKYYKFKMKKIKEAHEKGNKPLARRHANELLQYFGIGDREMPIENQLEQLE